MSTTPASETGQLSVANFYSGDFSLEDAPIINVQGSPDTDFVDDSFVFVRSANLLRGLTDTELDQTVARYRSILCEEGKLHIYEPRAPEALGSKLLQLLDRNGFSVVADYSPEEDFASLVGQPVETHPGDIRLVAQTEKKPHTHDALLSRGQFRQKSEEFRLASPNAPAVSWVISVHNEARNLPHFFAFLENSEDETGMEREFIFVVNGCTDSSESMLADFVAQSELNTQLIRSEIGIVPSFKKGITARTLDGFVGRFDADIALHPQTLDLLQMHLVENEDARVTYAEPLTLESETIFNTSAHHPEVMTKRLYYSGKTSLYKQAPYKEEGAEAIPPQIVTEDIFGSFNYMYRRGFKAISRAPHAVVYEKVIGNFEDLVKQTSRANSEISRIFEAYPHFKILGDLAEQIVSPGAYYDLLKRAGEEASYVDGWTRLESTK